MHQIFSAGVASDRIERLVAEAAGERFARGVRPRRARARIGRVLISVGERLDRPTSFSIED